MPQFEKCLGNFFFFPKKKEYSVRRIHNYQQNMLLKQLRLKPQHFATGYQLVVVVCTTSYILRICLPHQHKSSVYHTNMKFVRHAIFNLQSDWATAMGRLLGPVLGIPGIQSLSQDTTMYFSAQESNRESTTLRLPIYVHIH